MRNSRSKSPRNGLPNPNPRKVQPLAYPLMKPTLYLLITAFALLLAIAVSSGKLGGMSDLEARKRASEPFSR